MLKIILCVVAAIAVVQGGHVADVSEEETYPVSNLAVDDIKDETQVKDWNLIPGDDDDDSKELVEEELPAVFVTDEAEGLEEEDEDEDEEEEDVSWKQSWKSKRKEEKKKRGEIKHKRKLERKEKKHDKKQEKKSSRREDRKALRKQKKEKWRRGESEEDQGHKFSKRPNGMSNDKKLMSKISRKVARKDKPKGSKLEKEVQNLEEDEVDTEVKGLYDSLPRHHGDRWQHKRGHGRKHHRRGGKSHRYHHKSHRPRFHDIPVEKRVAMICMKLGSEGNGRFASRLNQGLEKGEGKVERKSYRLEFIGRMRACCNHTEQERIQCYESLTRARYDNFCDSQMPLKPWAPASPRQRMMARTLNTTCCHLFGEERYDCFNKTMTVMRQGRVEEPMEEAEEEIAEPSSSEVEELLSEDSEEDEDEEAEDGVNKGHGHGRRGGKGRRHHRGHKRRFAGHVKRKCCHAGRETGSKITKVNIRKKCLAGAIKYARERKTLKAMCGLFYTRCCVHTAANGTEDVVVEEPLPIEIDFADADDDDDEDDDFNEQDEEEDEDFPSTPELGTNSEEKSLSYVLAKKNKNYKVIDNKHHDRMID